MAVTIWNGSRWRRAGEVDYLITCRGHAARALTLLQYARSTGVIQVEAHIADDNHPSCAAKEDWFPTGQNPYR
jgi:hypothetical protein